jgi:hypothetical protein
VEVDEQEREDDPVPECVHERSELEHVDRTRQLRVEAPDVVAHAVEANRASPLGGPVRSSTENFALARLNQQDVVMGGFLLHRPARGALLLLILVCANLLGDGVADALRLRGRR